MRARAIVGLWMLVSASGCSGIAMGEMNEYMLDSPELAHAGVSDAGVWESAPWSAPDAPWIPYPPRVTVELEHTLGYAPSVVLVYISFDAEATTPALAPGDLAEILDVTDTTITVHNDTNGSYFIRVVAF